MSSKSPKGFTVSRATKLRDAANGLRASRTRFGDVYVGTQAELDGVRGADAVLTKAADMLDEFAFELKRLTPTVEKE